MIDTAFLEYQPGISQNQNTTVFPGVSKSVCGMEWLLLYLERLTPTQKCNTVHIPGNCSFKFSNICGLIPSVQQVTLPEIKVDNFNYSVELEVEVVMENIPLLVAETDILKIQKDHVNQPSKHTPIELTHTQSVASDNVCVDFTQNSKIPKIATETMCDVVGFSEGFLQESELSAGLEIDSEEPKEDHNNASWKRKKSKKRLRRRVRHRDTELKPLRKGKKQCNAFKNKRQPWISKGRHRRRVRHRDTELKKERKQCNASWKKRRKKSRFRGLIYEDRKLKEKVCVNYDKTDIVQQCSESWSRRKKKRHIQLKRQILEIVKVRSVKSQRQRYEIVKC